jgi:hypothetical protein
LRDGQRGVQPHRLLFIGKTIGEMSQNFEIVHLAID